MDIEKFEKTETQLSGFFEEVSTLSKKKPDDAINKFKLKFINMVIEDANNLLVSDYKPFQEFNKFDEDDIPSNSDVVFILSQYLNCLEILRRDNIGQMSGSWYWRVNGELTNKRTKRPL
ncbi:hypothetical protein [Fictibacillus barbaricus]|uniref:Uncharacterized protein n=1 Tax=Fictibacillus barbaricus TaxID=182136 RepID=A0ABU1TUZ3_9BACL|nr:hypothetical protein [Fictibacillus barbaricus]MDR7071034.1 hypothetical protein [Fictibacillus barbaricus]